MGCGLGRRHFRADLSKRASQLGFVASRFSGRMPLRTAPVEPEPGRDAAPFAFCRRKLSKALLKSDHRLANYYLGYHDPDAAAIGPSEESLNSRGSKAEIAHDDSAVEHHGPHGRILTPFQDRDRPPFGTRDLAELEWLWETDSVRVFISSVMEGFGRFREVAAEAALLLGHQVVRVEDFPALATTPQQACLQGIRECDVVVLLLGGRYGAKQASGKSAVEEEFDEAVRAKPVLTFNQTGADREIEMTEFAKCVRDWAGGTFTADFSTPAELRDRVTAALARHALREQAGQIDDVEMIERAVRLLPIDQKQFSNTLGLSVSCGPTQQLLRPAEIESPELCEAIKQEAMFGTARVIDSNEGARCLVRGDTLVIENPVQRFLLEPLGTLAFIAPARSGATAGAFEPMVEEDVTDWISRTLLFFGLVLDRIDPTARATAVAPVAVLLGATAGWQTRVERDASRGRMSISTVWAKETMPVTMTPATRPRAHLQQKAQELAEDFTVLLRRQSCG